MNKQQRSYSLAQAEFIKAEQALNKAEEQYIAEHEIRNPDGTAPKSLWMLDDDELFDIHVTAFGKFAEESGLDMKRNAAKERLKKAEDDLIEFGLSIAPARIRDTLRTGVQTRATIREKFIETTYKLDISTI